ncbi:MAG: AAA family ATPase [Hormoscilla sp. GUM202]|nr:AAA family ATPase [Hormoscilla sp. GUM202]
MLKSLIIENFRGFKTFELQDLGRVNLLVGTNNSGKTSILEALHILCSRTDMNSIQQLMAYRGEYWWTETDGSKSDREYDIRHLFHRQDIEPGSKFSILGVHSNHQEKLVASIHSREQSEQVNMDDDRDLGELNLVVNWTGQKVEEDIKLPLSPGAGISANYIQRRRQIARESVTQFLTPFSLEVGDIIAMFDRVVLTPKEAIAIQALQAIEPTIERIASVSIDKSRYSTRQWRERGGFLVRCSDRNQPIPIGSMGDGVWRMLGLVLAILCTQGGVLLVDEIDSGLHFTTMSDMWRVIWEIATKLDVQVFATTHNSDCCTSLASITGNENVDCAARTRDRHGITIQRIEPGKTTAVVFNEREIAIAAERGIEVR